MGYKMSVKKPATKACLMRRDNLLHKEGRATKKALSPLNLRFDLGSPRSSWSADLRFQAGVQGRSNSERKGGTRAFKDFKTNKRILNWTLKYTGSQWGEPRVGWCAPSSGQKTDCCILDQLESCRRQLANCNQVGYSNPAETWWRRGLVQGRAII